MLGFVLAVIFAFVLIAVISRGGDLKRGSPLPWVLLGGYFLRLVLQFFLRDLVLFTSAGGDAPHYERLAQTIALIWRIGGVHFMTAEEMPDLGATVLPANIFALVVYANGGELTRLGCTAVVALAAALAMYNIYKLALEFGAESREALLVVSLLYFGPAFLNYTSDMYKDGLVLFFVVGALGSSIRLARRVSIVHAAIGAVCLLALWYVRFYLVYVAIAPLAVGAAGIGARSIVRPVVIVALVTAVGLGLAVFTDILQLTSEHARETFEASTSTTLRANATAGGSSVEFDDGGAPFGAFGPKLAYTLFSPFLWSRGSLGFQVGKVDVLIWYYLIYRAIRASRFVDPQLPLMLLVFLVPSTVMYATSMANIGLMVRQRLVIVAATVVLAACYRRRPAMDDARVVIARA